VWVVKSSTETVNILVTAGNTLVPIDRVRCITNIFTGRTGTQIALESNKRGHEVTLLTSQPETLEKLLEGSRLVGHRWAMRSYRLFGELQELLRLHLTSGRFDALIHSAAVSDYQAAGVYAPAADTRFHPEDGHWQSLSRGPAALVDRAAEKVKSNEPELWLRLARTPKLIDSVRTDWNFHGVLVKFKLEAGVDEEQLLQIAERSRRQSAADLLVANTLEGRTTWALLGPIGASYQRVARPELASQLLDAVEQCHKERAHG
jgi:phosphopantothenate-cysteine ligase/phosphopantothenoylcysteine decarboxylase/phosphopantothenate--cysteine ligase